MALFFISINLLHAEDRDMVLEGLDGDVTTNEYQAFIDKLNYLPPPPTNNVDNHMVDERDGARLHGMQTFYAFTHDRRDLDMAIVWSDAFLHARNDSANGRIIWTGQRDLCWPNMATNDGVWALHSGVENGDVIEHIVNTARLILENPSIWSEQAPTDTFGFGATYLGRAETYVRECQRSADTTIVPWFVRTTKDGYRLYYPDSAAYFKSSDGNESGPIPWNQQQAIVGGLLRLAQCHRLLNDGNTNGIREPFVQRFAGVLLEVHAGDAHALARPVHLNIDPAVLRKRFIVLRDLITLGQVGIEIILAGKARARIDGAVERHGRLRAHGYDFAIQHRQRPRQPQANRADVAVRRVAETRRAATKNLGLGQKLDVHLQPDDGFILGADRSGHGHFPSRTAGFLLSEYYTGVGCQVPGFRCQVSGVAGVAQTLISVSAPCGGLQCRRVADIKTNVGATRERQLWSAGACSRFPSAEASFGGEGGGKPPHSKACLSQHVSLRDIADPKMRGSAPAHRTLWHGHPGRAHGQSLS